MLKRSDNERITRVGPGTPMGEVMRRYWQPVLLSEELPERDGAPVRLRALGEDLVAFRDGSGVVGIVDAYCPHRRAPLFYGRNEEHGLRCVYHGWKFSGTGECVDLPSEPPDSLFKTKVKIKAYPAYEKAGLIWAYMGSPAEQPTPPDFEWMRAAEGYRFISKTHESCNWLQGLEGGLDTAHASFTHNEHLQKQETLIRNLDRHPRLAVEKMDYGFRYSSTRDLGSDGTYVRVNHFVMPNIQLRGFVLGQEGRRGKFPKLDGHMWLPIDDETSYVYNMMWAYDASTPFTEEYIESWEELLGRGKDAYLPGPGYRLVRSRDNDYLIDRQRQKTETYTGITGINTQDWALQEGMGAVVDRSKEHLGTTDTAIITARQLLLEACDTVAAGGTPRGANPSTYREVRPYDDIVPRDKTWKEAWAGELAAKW
jgi:phthalate 4,5-dioxygenase oxygenase subunit